jgi:hypothetical protein
MILPNKYINLSESLFGFSAYLSQFLNKPISLDELWNVYQQQVKSGNYPIRNDFNELVLSIDLLYLMGLIKVTNDNKIELIKNNLATSNSIKKQNILEDSNTKNELVGRLYEAN